MAFRKLKALRVENNISQYEIAKFLGITQSTYSWKENGKAEFTISEIEKLKKFFNLPYESIFFREVAHVLNTDNDMKAN